MTTLRQITLAFTLFGLSKISIAQFTGTNPIQQASTGNVAIGFPTYTPSSLLQVRNGSVLFEGTTGATPAFGAGTRMMWIPAKGAFRAGLASTTSWDNANIGLNSFAVNSSNQASGSESFACGLANSVSGASAFATGNLNVVSGAGAFTAGGGNNLSGSGAFAAGNANNVSGSNATTFGSYNVVQSYSSFVIGQYNLTPGNYNTTSWVATDPLFVIGNGAHIDARANALTVLKNGNIGIGVSSPNDKLSINGNLRMNNNAVYLSGDVNHGLGYYNVFTTTGNYANKTIDGPVLFGWSGGALGTINSGVKNIALSWNVNGNVGIGTSNPGNYKLAVEGILGARALKITVASWADFVFDNDYILKPLKEVEAYIKENKHLPEVPTALEIEKDGLDVAKIQAKQMQKIEELTLYLIELNKKIEKLENENTILENK